MRLVRQNLVFLACALAAGWTIYCLVLSTTAIAEITEIVRAYNPEAQINPQLLGVLAVWFWAAPFSAFIGLALIVRPAAPAANAPPAAATEPTLVQPTAPADRVDPALPERPV